MTETMNLLVIMSDEHAPGAISALGHPIVRTPYIDRLVERGTTFTSAYTPSPLCVPARAAIATGRPVHEIGAWDNAHPYEGTPAGWAHAATAAGIDTLSIGKLHFRSEKIDSGFAETLLPLHVVESHGDVLGALRDPLPRRTKGRALAAGVGIGETPTTRYDRAIADTAIAELSRRAENNADAPPWLMFVSFVAPHFPLTAPGEFASLYPAKEMPLPERATSEERDHPWFARMRESLNWDEGFDDDTRRRAIAAYYALTSFMDANVGRVISALETTGLIKNTRVIYLSDHGEALGKRDLWGKSTLYEESVGVPLILSGPDIPTRQFSEPVSLTDIDGTVREALGLRAPGRSGTSLLAIAQERKEPPPDVLAQFHGGGSPSGAYMLRFGDWKYVHYVGHPPQLFNLSMDPDEANDLAGRPDAAYCLEEGERRLRSHLDPEETDRTAKAAQAALVERFGGRDAVLSRQGFEFTPPPKLESQPGVN